jgi:hypothetical protein
VFDISCMHQELGLMEKGGCLVPTRKLVKTQDAKKLLNSCIQQDIASVVLATTELKINIKPEVATIYVKCLGCVLN